MDNKILIGFSIGAAVGAAVSGVTTYLVVKKKFEAEEERFVAEMESYYKTKDEYVRNVREQVMEEIPITDGKEERPSKYMTIDERQQKKQQLRKELSPDFEEKHGYRYDQVKKDIEEQVADPADYEHPEDDVPEEETFQDELDEEERQNELGRQETLQHQEERGRSPKIISSEAAGDLPPGYMMDYLYYYTEDMAVYDDMDNKIDDPETLLGDCLDKYGFSNPSNTEEIIYVQNYKLSTVYEVNKVVGAMEDRIGHLTD